MILLQAMIMAYHPQGSKFFALLDPSTEINWWSRPMAGSLYLFRTVDGGSSWNQVACDGLPDAESSELDPMDIIRINATDVIKARQGIPENGQMGHTSASPRTLEQFQVPIHSENVILATLAV